ncbi:MAG: DUF523 and DUF1722 domain-containing protein [candidate division Zixibacteria bacterium]|nr:DUF523 and DUF1722 domain-containing protein [candidate division Zixibacteria bacterium]
MSQRSHDNSEPGVVRPVVVVSKCLEFEACRYNGQKISFDWVDRLRDQVTFLPVCPEVEIGLGIPRDPIKIVKRKDALHLVQPSTERDVSDDMHAFAERFLQSLSEVDGFILKSRSPSCGIKDVKLYTGKREEMASGKTTGMFAAHVLKRFGGLAIEDEGRLTNLRLREHWLTKLFALARFRHLAARPSAVALVRFQAENKLLLMAYHQTRMRQMGHLVANHDHLPLAQVVADYRALLQEALAKPPRATSHVNVLMHAMGYFKDKISSAEKRHFLRELDRFVAGRLPFSALSGILNSWIERFDESYLRPQTYFSPYPEALVDLKDTGR